MVAKSARVECQLIKGRVVLYNENRAFSSFKRSKKIKVGSLKNLSKAPATSPLAGRGIE